MGKIKDILVETRDLAFEMKNAQGNNCLARAQFACQIWNLTQMINFANRIESVARNMHNKCK